MNIDRLLWNDDVVTKIERKHRVSQEEVESVFFDSRPHIRCFGNVYYAFGQTVDGRYLFIPFVFLGKGIARPITARDMTAGERQLFKKIKE
jgi:hypothetical protein